MFFCAINFLKSLSFKLHVSRSVGWKLLSLGSLHYGDVYKCESGRCHTVPFFYHLLSENFFRLAEQKFCTYWIRVTRNARICHARSGKVDSSHCYLDRRPLRGIATFDEIVSEYDKNNSQQLVYVALSRVILNVFLILYACVDNGMYYKLYLKALKSNNTAHLSFTN